MTLSGFISFLVFSILIINCFYVQNSALLGNGSLYTDSVNTTHLVVKEKSQLVKPQLVKPQLVKPSVELNTYDLVLIITSDKEVLNKELKDCILMLSLYQRSFSCKGVVFSDSEAVRNFASQSDVMTIGNVTRNKYGLPIVTSLFQRAHSVVNGSFYGYINSDIILNPRVFSLLPNVTNLIDQGKLSPRLELAARVIMVKPFLQPNHFTSITNFTTAIDLHRRGVIRHPCSADVFIFARTFPFDKIPPAVVGRIRVDNVILKAPSLASGTLVDFTYYAPNYHQGFDGFTHHGFKNQTKGDKNYNNRFVRWGSLGVLYEHAEYSVDSNGEFQVIIRKKKKKKSKKKH